VPHSLLNQGHPEAAVTVAFGLLEQALTWRAEQLQASRPPGIMRLIQWAATQGILQGDELNRFRKWVGLRNRAVHTSEPIDLAAAREAVADIEALLMRLDWPR
jgi:hypothetical protein